MSSLLPSYGPSDKSTEISIFGYGFEIGVCKEINCLFDNLKTSAELFNLNVIKCKSPMVSLEQKSAVKSVQIYLEINKSVYNTNFNYTFLPSKQLTLTDDDDDEARNFNTKNEFSFICLLLSLVLSFKF